MKVGFLNMRLTIYKSSLIRFFFFLFPPKHLLISIIKLTFLYQWLPPACRGDATGENGGEMVVFAVFLAPSDR